MWVLLLLTMKCCSSSKILYIIPNTSVSLSRDEENFRAFYKDGQLFSRDRTIDVTSGVYNVLLENKIGQYFDNDLAYHVKETWVRDVPSVPLQTAYKLSVLLCDIMDAEVIYWQKKSKVWTNIKVQGERMYVTSLNTLVIQNTIETDLGRYRCVVLDKESKIALIGPDQILEHMTGHSEELKVISNNSPILDNRGVYIIAASKHREELLGYLPIEFFTRCTCYYKATDGTKLNVIRSGPYYQASTSSSLSIYLHGSDIIDDVISSNDVTTTALPPTPECSCPIISLKLDIIDPPDLNIRIMSRENTVIFGYPYKQDFARYHCFLNARPLPSSEQVAIIMIGSELKVHFLCPAEIYHGYLQCAIQIVQNKLFYYSRPVKIDFPRPDFPSNSSCIRAQLSNVSGSSVVVSWPCIVNITSYVVSVRAKEEDGSLVDRERSYHVTCQTTKCNATVSKLKPGTSYQCNVLADTTEFIVAAVSSFTTLSSLSSVSDISMNCVEKSCVVEWSSPHDDTDTSYIVTMKSTGNVNPSILIKRVTREKKIEFHSNRLEDPCETTISIIVCYKMRCQLKGADFIPLPVLDNIRVKPYHNHISIHFRSGPCFYLLVKFNDRIIKFNKSPGIIEHLQALSKHRLWYKYVTYGNNSDLYGSLKTEGDGLTVTLPLSLWLVGVLIGLSVLVVVIIVIVLVNCRRRTGRRQELIRQQPWSNVPHPSNITIQHD